MTKITINPTQLNFERLAKNFNCMLGEQNLGNDFCTSRNEFNLKFCRKKQILSVKQNARGDQPLTTILYQNLMTLSIFTFCYMALLCVYTPKIVLAAGLEELVESSELERIEKEGKNKPLISGLIPGSSMHELFASEDGDCKADLWLDIPDGHYKLIKNKLISPTTSRGSLRTYQNRQGKKVYVHMLVPHPRQEEAARFRLLPEFSELTRLLKIKFTEDIKVGHRKAQLLTLADGNCQVNIDLTRGTLLAVRARCEDSDEIQNYLKLASIDRLEQKLDN